MKKILLIMALSVMALSVMALSVHAQPVKFYLSNYNSTNDEMHTWAWADETGALKETAIGDAAAILRNAINYAVANGMPFSADCRTYLVNGHQPFLILNSSVGFPPSVGMKFEFDNCLILSRPVDGGDAFILDSSETMVLKFEGGEVLYRGYGCAFRLHPQLSTTTDSFTGINLARIDFGQVTVQPASPGDVTYGQPTPNACGIEMDPSSGSFFGNVFTTGQADCKLNCANTIRVKNPSSTTVFRNNKFNGGMIASATQSTIQIGEYIPGQPLPTGIYGNIWEFGSIDPNVAGADGFNSWANGDTLIAGSVGGNVQIWRTIVWEPGATNNAYRVGIFGPSNSGTTNGIVDAGTTNHQM
ncbi:MAG: hypothetical protein WC856_08015 [Methylococcaceae bacterium]